MPTSQPIPVFSPTALLDTLDELARLVEEAKPVFLSADVRVDREAALGLIDDLRHEMPAAVTRADDFLTQAQQERDQAVADADVTRANAREDADSIVATAKQRAQELVEKEQVVAQAHVRAADIIAAAQGQAAKLRKDADEYCDSQLAAFDRDLEAVKNQVAAGRQKLAGRLGAGAGRTRWDQVQDPAWPGGENGAPAS
ncbi:MAG: hypothetical protein LBB54_01030 [Cellulomonadaceae bacterium]|jgi:F0F1-type ATP synthase membrane subunit b/b'|nr:hypothetical protein [Cellulomonadaceae bacterium]